MRFVSILMGLIVSATETPQAFSLKDVLARIDNGNLYQVEILGIPALHESVFRITPERLRESYTYRIEIRDIRSVASCERSFRNALSRVVLTKGQGPQPHDLRLGLIISGRSGTPPVALYAERSGTFVADDSTGDGSSLLEWVDTHLVDCLR